MASHIGILGGTFDPPHLGHLILASEARQQLNLARLLWMITPTSPHKIGQSVTEPRQRVEMVARAIADEPAFELSTLELDRPAPQYTIDTLEILQRQNPASALTLLLGADSLSGLHTWHRPADLVRACHTIGVMRRPGESIRLEALDGLLPGLAEKVRFIEAPLFEISSREIRRRVKVGLEFRYFVPRAVFDYIQTNRLYEGG